MRQTIVSFIDYYDKSVEIEIFKKMLEKMYLICPLTSFNNTIFAIVFCNELFFRKKLAIAAALPSKFKRVPTLTSGHVLGFRSNIYYFIIFSVIII